MTTTRRGTYPDGVAVSPDGRYLYAINGQGDSVTAFAIGAGGALTRRLFVRSGGLSPEAVVVSPAQAPAPTFSKRISVGHETLTLTMPPSSVCQGTGGVLAVSLKANSSSHGARLRFKTAAFYIDKGLGRHHKPNAIATKLPASEQLSLQGVLVGPHKLTVRLVYESTGSTVTKTLKQPFSVCPRA
jgi:hypothetical protein